MTLVILLVLVFKACSDSSHSPLRESSKITNHLLRPFINSNVEWREAQPTHRIGTGWLTGVVQVGKCLANGKQKRPVHLCQYPAGCSDA